MQHVILQVNSSGCCFSAQCGRGIPASTSRPPSNAKSSWWKIQLRTSTMVFSPTTSCSTQPSPELSPWLQSQETPQPCALLDDAGKALQIIYIFPNCWTKCKLKLTIAIFLTAKIGIQLETVPHVIDTNTHIRNV